MGLVEAPVGGLTVKVNVKVTRIMSTIQVKVNVKVNVNGLTVKLIVKNHSGGVGTQKLPERISERT